MHELPLVTLNDITCHFNALICRLKTSFAESTLQFQTHATAAFNL